MARVLELAVCLAASSHRARLRKKDHSDQSLVETTCLDASRRAPTAASRETAAGGTTLWEMTTDPVPPSMFAGYHYTVNPKKPGYDGLWGTHPEFGLMRGTENIIGTSATRRGKALRSGAYAIFMNSSPSDEVVGGLFFDFESLEDVGAVAARRRERGLIKTPSTRPHERARTASIRAGSSTSRGRASSRASSACFPRA